MEQINRLLTSTWLQYLNTKLHSSISFLSPIQGEKLGWYFWLAKASGVFELTVLEWQSCGMEEESTFILRYYPYPDDDYFLGLSSSEQIIRLSNWFDDSPFLSEPSIGCACSALACHQHPHSIVKGIPRLHLRKSIHPSLFTVGDIKFLMEEGRLSQVSLTSQNHIRLIFINGVSIEHEGSLVQLRAPGEVDRDLLGWNISWFYFEVLIKEVLPRIGLYLKSCRRKTAPGLLYYKDEGGEVYEKVDPTVTKITHTFYF